MKNLAKNFESSFIRNIYLQSDQLHATINLPDGGVFMVMLSESDKVLTRRFVQLESGHNNLQFLTGILKSGEYMLSVIKGSTILNGVFNI